MLKNFSFKKYQTNCVKNFYGKKPENIVLKNTKNCVKKYQTNCVKILMVKNPKTLC